MSIINRTALKNSFKLAWPISLQNTLVTLLSMIDVMMVSHLGNASVAAVGFGNRVQFVVLVIVSGLAWGVGILSAQNHGAGNTSRIRSTILLGLILSTLALLPLVIGNFFFADSLMALGTTDQDVIDIGEMYLWITMPSLLFVGGIMVFENALRSISQVKLPMVISTFAIVINIVLNYWLIYGGLGIEPLGVTGAAIATLIARGCHLLLIFMVLSIARHKLKPSRNDVKDLRIVKPWFDMIKLVVPLMASFGVWSIGSFVYQLIYGRLGTQELAVISLLVPIEGMFISLFFGFASACSIMVGQNLGAEKFDQAISIAKSFVIMAPLVAIVLGVLLLLAEPIIFMPFSDMPASTLALASDVFLIIALGAWIKISNMTMALGILRAGGETKACLYIDTFGMWMVSIPLTLMAAFYFDLPLFWVALTAYSEEVSKFGLFVWRISKQRWVRKIVN
ncbi:MATE family efflux transporter [Thalassotalea aquiviva]|uniref:MATE family efflux transporter n=1 Tax=Thalassotalea aquiviva TaxID=3242415 RepID=UPI00352B5989